jgi:hypothetical protein
MNYAVVFLAALLLAAAVFWYIRGRKYYTGPLVEAIMLNDDSSGAEVPSDIKKLEA